MAAAPPSPSESPTRRPYTGSCHCGLTKYIAYITLPPSQLSPTAPPKSTTRIRKCNCTTCHKMSFFHVRLMDAHHDFILLSPLSSSPSFSLSKPEEKEEKKGQENESAHGGIAIGEGGLKDYTCFEANIHWYFCSQCGVRCFALAGHGQLRSISLPSPPSSLSSSDTPSEEKEVWTPQENFLEGRPEGENEYSYLSINAATLDAGQEGLDLRRWHERGWIEYFDILGERMERSFGVPWEGGMY